MRILRADLPGGRADGRPPAGAFARGRPVGWQLSDRLRGLQSEEGAHAPGALSGPEPRCVSQLPRIRDTRLETTSCGDRRGDPEAQNRLRRSSKSMKHGLLDRPTSFEVLHDNPLEQL